MINFENKNLPEAVENKEKTIKRLKKIENIAQSAKKTFVSFAIGAGATAGMLFGGLYGVAAGAAFGAMVAPAAATIPVIVENLAHLKIASLRKKMRPSSMQEMLEEQQKKTQNSKEHYASMLKNYDSNSLEAERQDIAFQEKRDDIFHKATTLAKQDDKEKTIQRLMSLASKANPSMSETYKQGIYTTIGGITSAVAVPAATKIIPGAIAYAKARAAFNPDMWSIVEMQKLQSMPHYSPSAAIAIGVTAMTAVAATACCAARTVQSYKEQQAAHKALKVLEKYTEGRFA